MPDLRIRYLQVDTKHKCVPVDWFIGYDTFTVYTFLNLVGFGSRGARGYLKTLMRDDHSSFLIDF